MAGRSFTRAERCSGGCSSINGMIYMRGQAADYDHWRQLGCIGLGLGRRPADLPAQENHYGGGIGLPRRRWRMARREAARPLGGSRGLPRGGRARPGIPRTEDFNRGDNEGSGYFDVNQRSGWRWNTAKAFLRPAMGRPNLRVETKAQAKRLVIEDGEVRGVDYVQHDGQQSTSLAPGETVLSAGAIGSPHLLELSGIGDPDDAAARPASRW